jgi:hypothetical protein
MRARREAAWMEFSLADEDMSKLSHAFAFWELPE